MRVFTFALCVGSLIAARLVELSAEDDQEARNLPAEFVEHPSIPLVVHQRNATVIGKDWIETSEEVKVHQDDESLVGKDLDLPTGRVSTNTSASLLGLDSVNSSGHARSLIQAIDVTGSEENHLLLMAPLLMLTGIFIGCFLLCCLANAVPKEELEPEPGPEGTPTDDNDELDMTAVLTTGVKKTLARLSDMLPSRQEDDSEPEETYVQRLVLTEEFFVLNDELGKQFVDYDASKPVLPKKCAREVSQLSAWHRGPCGLVEEADGLILGVKLGEEETAHQLLSWSDNSARQLEVILLPTIVFEKKRLPTQSIAEDLSYSAEDDYSSEAESNASEEGADPASLSSVQFCAQASIMSMTTQAPTSKAEPTSLQAFAIKWNKTCIAVLGCPDEEVVSRWVSNLNVYANIRQRYYSNLMWKLNADIVADLPMDIDEAKEDLSDVRHWRKRLCLLEYLHSEQSLCISIMSETDEEARVGNVLASAEQGVVASVQAGTPVPLMPLASWEEEKARVNAHQYSIALAGASVQDTTLPTVFYTVEVRQKTTEYGGQEHSMYAFECEASRSFFLHVLAQASDAANPSGRND